MNFVGIEAKGKQIFAKFPKTRRFIKGIYHRTSYFLSRNKVKNEGNIIRISPDDNYEYFYGYYDKSPWDITDRYILAIQVKNAHKVPDSTEQARVVVFDTENNNKMEIIATTNCWNTQQGCMAQWLAPDYKTKIIYNDFRNGKYVSVVYNFISKKEEMVYDIPVYDVAKNGKFALSLDFSRLHRLRKGYGYANTKEETIKELCPDKPCIWKLDLETGKVTEVIKYTNLANFETRPEMKNAEHKVNHIMISPNGKRFMVLHRWFKHNEKFTRLVTMDIDGTSMYNLSDDNFVSHCCWKNNTEILSFLRKKDTKDHYYLMKDKSKDYRIFWKELDTDGHCTYSPNGKYIITDTYPDRKRQAYVYLCEEGKHSKKIASVFAPFKYDNDVRCDLHPRWNHNNNMVCIDSVHEGKKEIYVIPLQTERDENKIPKIIHSVWFGNGKKSELSQKCIASWHKYLKDYKFFEWTEQNFDLKNAPKYVQEALKAKKWAFVSDYVRLKVLYEHGGIYMDTDMELFDSLDNHLKYDGFFCIESLYTVSTAIIATKPKSKWIKDLLDEYKKINFINSDGSYNQMPNTKRVYNYLKESYDYKYSNSIRKYRDGLIIYPSEYFSPLNCFTGKLKKTKNTNGMHHYDNTWKSTKEKMKKKILQIITRMIGEERRHKMVEKREERREINAK